MNAPKALPLPAFYEAKQSEHWAFGPDAQRLLTEATAWRRAHSITPSTSDKRNVHLLLIDMQKDFCFPQGTLYVGGRSGRGALDDTRRTCEFIYRNLDVLTHITATMDTHFAFQIFSPAFWVNAEGQTLSPFREISTEDIDRGTVRPNPAVAGWLCNGDYVWLSRQVRYYCAELERVGKYKLYLWPPHCVLGSDGHALVGTVQEARLFHSYVRSAQSWTEVKGGNALTENYSVLRPEVLTHHDGGELARGNTPFIKTLLASDAVIIAGQAASHCVKSSIEDLLKEIVATDRALARKVYILSDCMSAVTVSDGKGGFVADFTPLAEQALERFAEAGMHIVRSSDPIASWPEM